MSQTKARPSSPYNSTTEYGDPYNQANSGPIIPESSDKYAGENIRPVITFSFTKVYTTATRPDPTVSTNFLIYVIDELEENKVQYSTGSAWVSVNE